MIIGDTTEEKSRMNTRRRSSDLGMARVLVPAGLDNSAQNCGMGELNFARTSYLRKLIRYGLTPVVLTPYATPLMVDDLYSLCDGILLMGGEDIDPALYGEVPHVTTRAGNPRRDALERELTERALEDRKPLIAICRGCQMLAVAAGGSLHQHVPDIVPSEVHRPASSASYEHRMSAVFHEVMIEPGSKARKILGTDMVKTNSSHHQAVRDPGSGLRVAGRTAEGVIEILEHEDPDYFCYGVQSHPEAFEESFLERFFTGFAQALTTCGDARLSAQVQPSA